MASKQQPGELRRLGTTTAKEGLVPLHAQAGRLTQARMDTDREESEKESQEQKTESHVSGRLTGSRSSANCRGDIWTGGQMDRWTYSKMVEGRVTRGQDFTSGSACHRL